MFSNKQRNAIKKEAQELLTSLLGPEAGYSYQDEEDISNTADGHDIMKIEICDVLMTEGNAEEINQQFRENQNDLSLNTASCSNSTNNDPLAGGDRDGGRSMGLTLQTLLTTLVEQNKTILEDNKHIRNSLRKVLEQNRLLLEENLKLKYSLQEQTGKLDEQQKQMDDHQKRMEEDQKKSSDMNVKLYSHFTEEFIRLRGNVENLLESQKLMPTAWFVPVLSTPEEILQFDEQILEDENIKYQLMNRFENQPRDEIRKFVYENLKLIFKDDHIASKFSWSQMNNNISVKDLNLIRLLKDIAVDKIPQTTSSTVEAHMKTFFTSAKDRLHKRNKRKIEAII